MSRARTGYLALASVLGAGLIAATRPVPTIASAAVKPAIVLVHGAFADGSGWAEVIRILQKDGYDVTAAQIPLSSYAEDVATTKRLIDAQTGPVVVVGHSYGGAVITTAAAGSSNVSALVYIAAFGPEAGEPIGAYLEKYPSMLGEALRPDAAGFAYIDRAAFHDLFARDLPKADADIAAAAQKPVHGSVFTSSPTAAAWKTIPSWYIVAQEDKAINPDLERFYAKRMGATTKEIKASHVGFISHSKEVARIIEDAATIRTAAK
jgi:pimeloyl-ACP methyl ester carboxylesterase